MSSGYATPIRLILDDDEKTAIRLDATRIGMSVERKTGGSPVPFSGGRRMGMDLNMSNSVIVIDGVFVDDTRDRAAIAATSAVAEIDFGISQNDIQPPYSEAEAYNMVGGFLISPIEYEFYDKDGNKIFSVEISEWSGNGKGGSTGFVDANAYVFVSGTKWKLRGYNGSTYATNVQLAAALYHLIANQKVDDASGANISAYFTASLTSSSNTDITDVSNKKVVITTTTAYAGKYGPDGVISANRLGAAFIARYRTTDYGTNATSGYAKSAGDKVQDLYGILHNTIRGGAAALSGTISSGLGVATLVRLAGAALTEEQTVATATQEFKKSGDYPIGLQIPYNSMIQAADGQLYTARNFFIPTGRRMKGEKGSDANNLSADVEFSTTDNYTGIQGTVKNLEIGYDAGEAVYRYTLTFLPIDNIF